MRDGRVCPTWWWVLSSAQRDGERATGGHGTSAAPDAAPAEVSHAATCGALIGASV